MIHEINAVPDKQQYKRRRKVIEKMHVERRRLACWIKAIVSFERCLHQRKERCKKKGEDQKQNDLLVNGTQQQSIFADDLPHKMRADNTYFQKKKKPAKHRRSELPENKGKEYVYQPKQAP